MSEQEVAAKPGRKAFMETEEFKSAVAEAAGAAVAEQLSSLKEDLVAAARGEQRGTQQSLMSDLLTEVLSKLSTNLQATRQQGQYNKPISPEEIVRREVAHNRMIDLIIACREPAAIKPSYTVITPVYFNERLIQPFRQLPDKSRVRNEITWTGVPNRSLAPVNQPATVIWQAWDESTGGPPAGIPTADTRPYFMTAAGLTVKGDPPARRFVADDVQFKDDLSFANGDPNAPTVRVLGTVHAPAKQNIAGVQ